MEQEEREVCETCDLASGEKLCRYKENDKITGLKNPVTVCDLHKPKKVLLQIQSMPNAKEDAKKEVADNTLVV